MRESPLLLPVPSPNAPVQDLDGSPEPALALKSGAHNDVKMGFAISDEVIYVLTSLTLTYIHTLLVFPRGLFNIQQQRTL